MEFTFENCQKVNIIQNFLQNDLHIAYMIVKDSLLLDTYLDEKIETEEKILYLHSFKYNYRPTSIFDKMSLYELYKICTKLGMKSSHDCKFTRLYLTKYIQKNEFLYYKNIYNKKYFSDEKIKIENNITNNLKLLKNVALKNRCKVVCNFLKYLCDNKMFLILNPDYYKIFLTMIRNFKQFRDIKNHKKIQKYTLMLLNI